VSIHHQVQEAQRCPGNSTSFCQIVKKMTKEKKAHSYEEKKEAQIDTLKTVMKTV
jgi:hypothetical protein